MNSHGVISIIIPFRPLQPGPFPRVFLPLLVPYWAFGVNGGQVYFRETGDSGLLSQAQSEVLLAFPDQVGLFIPTSLIIVTWRNLTEFETGLQVPCTCTGHMN